ncbi:MAG: hypothetical protein ABSH27_04270 [Solirubrobacteraceae bacterium]
MIGSALRSELNKTGSCQTSIDNQLKTIDTFTLTVESIKLAGSAAATARVQTELDGKKVIQTVSLAHQSNGWRITAAPNV